MRAFITTVAGMSARFSESIGKPALKCIYHMHSPEQTLLHRMIILAENYDCIVIVGGFMFSELEDYIQTFFSKKLQEKFLLVYNDRYQEYGSGWSFYLGLKALEEKKPDEVLFAEGDLYIDGDSFRRIESSEYDVLTFNHETIRASKAVAFYYDNDGIPHYIYDTAHGSLEVKEPFQAIYNSGQIWKFQNSKELFEVIHWIPEEKYQGTNLVIINAYFEKISQMHQHIEVIPIEQWINCNTIDDFLQTNL